MRATSAEEQEEAPTAKMAKCDDEQIRVRARDGEEVTMSREVARLAGHLKDLIAKHDVKNTGFSKFSKLTKTFTLSNAQHR